MKGDSIRCIWFSFLKKKYRRERKNIFFQKNERGRDFLSIVFGTQSKIIFYISFQMHIYIYICTVITVFFLLFGDRPVGNLQDKFGQLRLSTWTLSNRCWAEGAYNKASYSSFFVINLLFYHIYLEDTYYNLINPHNFIIFKFILPYSLNKCFQLYSKNNYIIILF